MKKDLDSILEEVLLAIEQGENAEACLARYPEQAEALRPLLQTVQMLRSLREEVPSPSLARGRELFLREAARLRRRERVARWKVQWRRFLQGLTLSPVVRRGWAVAVLTVTILACLMGWGVVVASAQSLPGDPLYPMKLAVERVQLTFTFDPEERAQLEEQFQARRVQEARALLQMGRKAKVHFEGLIEEMNDDIWVVRGLQVTLGEDTRVEGDAQVGAEVAVDAEAQDNGVLLASRIVVIKPAIPRVPPPTFTPTRRPTRTPQPTPTPFPTHTHTPKPTSTPKPAPPTVTPTPVLPTGTPTRLIKIHFEGFIESLSETQWVIGGQAVLVNQDTLIDESRAKAEVGAWARVEAIRQDDGALLALRIVVLKGKAKPVQERVEFTGRIERIAETFWVVRGITVTINASTVIQGSPQVEYLAEVKALRQSDGSLLATLIVVRAPETAVEFEGLIESLSDTQWVVEGITVVVNVHTLIKGTPQVGAWAEVEGVALPDGTVLARAISVISPTSTPTLQVITPTATEVEPSGGSLPTATPTAVPTFTLTPTPTPTSAPILTPTPTSAPTFTPVPEATPTLTVAPSVTPEQ